MNNKKQSAFITFIGAFLSTLIVLTLIAPPVIGEDAGYLFYPLDPCRVVDTRVKSDINCNDFNLDGKWDDWECIQGVPGEGMKEFILVGDNNRVAYRDRGYRDLPYTIGDQGGSPTGCGIPRDAKAVHANITVIPHENTKSGHIKIWPFEVSYYISWGISWGRRDIPIFDEPPLSSAINWSAGSYAENSWMNVRVCEPLSANFGDCNEDILIWATAPVHVVIDVAGYYK